MRLLTAREVAALLHTSVPGLHSLRYRGDGPPAVRGGRGRPLLFAEGDVKAWLERGRDEEQRRRAPSPHARRNELRMGAGPGFGRASSHSGRHLDYPSPETTKAAPVKRAASATTDLPDSAARKVSGEPT